MVAKFCDKEYAVEKGLERSPSSQGLAKIGPSNCLNQPIPDTRLLGWSEILAEVRHRRVSLAGGLFISEGHIRFVTSSYFCCC
jgi:hypothetical protein